MSDVHEVPEVGELDTVREQTRRRRALETLAALRASTRKEKTDDE